MEIKTHFSLNDMENRTYQKLWALTKAMLGGTWIALNTVEK